MTSKGSLRAIEGARKTKKDRDEQHRQFVAMVEKRFAMFETELANTKSVIKELVVANNAASAVINAFEQFLDEKFPGWDEGKRKAISRKADLIQMRRGYYQKAARKDLTDADLLELAGDLWKVANELETRGEDVAIVVSLYLKANAIDCALDRIEEVETSGVELTDKVKVMVQSLKDRVSEIRSTK